MKWSIKKITYSAATAAIVFIVTWLVKLPIPATNGGYVNLGDAVIFFSAYILGGPAAGISSAVGSALADIAGGAAIYAPATFVIKGLMGLIFGCIAGNKRFFMYLAASIVCGAVMTIGYALYDTLLVNFAYALVSLPYNLLQWGGSIVVAAAFYPAAKRLADTLRIE